MPKSIFRIFEIIFNLVYIRISAISKRIHLIVVCLFGFQQTFGNSFVLFGNPLQAVFSKIEIFSAMVKFSSLYLGASRVPPWVLAVWAKTLGEQLAKALLYMKSSTEGYVRNNDFSQNLHLW